jgi:hypothetical protein
MFRVCFVKYSLSLSLTLGLGLKGLGFTLGVSLMQTSLNLKICHITYSLKILELLIGPTLLVAYYAYIYV